MGWDPPSQRGCRLAERNDAADFAGDEVKFSDRRGVPEGDEGTAAIVGDHGCVRQRTGDPFKSGEIKTVDDLSVGGVEQKGFVRIVASDEHAFNPVGYTYGEARGIGDIAKHFAGGASRVGPINVE